MREEPIYNRIGAGYDATRRADPYIAGKLGSYLSTGDGLSYLDVACGTGNYTVALAAGGGKWVGVDISREMVLRARSKSSAIQFSIAKAELLPFRDRSMAGAACVLAVHHFAELAPIFREAYRVIDSGTFVIFTSDPGQMRGFWLNEYFPEAMRRSIDQMPALDQVAKNLTEAGFCSIEVERYEVRNDLRDLFLYSGKHEPEMYLDERIRAGISTFSSLADPKEVQEGCARLALDIKTGRFSEVLEQYRNDKGDYVFVAGQKRLD